MADIQQVNILERVMIVGDLAQLSAQERVQYYGAVCKSIGLNPLTRPFEYITLNGRLTLYARKDATDQLRKINGISIERPDIRFEDDFIIVTVAARDAAGRSDSDIGVVSRKDMRGDFGNALMKAVTKAKRRVTLSICGLGLLDESEIESIPDAKPTKVTDDGVISENPPPLEKPINWRDRLNAAGIEAKTLHTVILERGDNAALASRMDTALQDARGVMQKNGSAKVEDIKRAAENLASLIVEAKNFLQGQSA
jgi:hypothetical protein